MKAEGLALAGKTGDALAEARAALDRHLETERAKMLSVDGDDMMRLVMCLPAIEAAAKEQS